MRAIDTNIIVRALAHDDPVQTAAVERLLAGGDLYVPLTVLLEAEWVLRTLYAQPPTRLIAALRNFVSLPGIAVERPAVAARALDDADGGMDFADALHLAGAAHCAAFVSFDVRLRKAAVRLGRLPVTMP